MPKLDLHVQGVSTETGTLARSNVNSGRLNYFNGNYPDGYTNNGNLIGNTVGREGHAIRCWFTYWISPQDTLRFSFHQNTVSPDFIPHGGTWQDYGLRNEMSIRSGFYVKSALQFEHISRFPLLIHGPQNNITAIMEVGFSPERRK